MAIQERQRGADTTGGFARLRSAVSFGHGDVHGSPSGDGREVSSASAPASSSGPEQPSGGNRSALAQAVEKGRAVVHAKWDTLTTNGHEPSRDTRTRRLVRWTLPDNSRVRRVVEGVFSARDTASTIISNLQHRESENGHAAVSPEEAGRSDEHLVFDASAKDGNQAESVLSKLIMKSGYMDEKHAVRGNVSDAITGYLDKARDRGVADDTAVNRFSTLHNFIRLRESHSKLKVKGQDVPDSIEDIRGVGTIIESTLKDQGLADDLIADAKKHIAVYESLSMKEYVQDEQWESKVQELAHAYVCIREMSSEQTDRDMGSSQDEEKREEPQPEFASVGMSHRGGIHLKRDVKFRGNQDGFYSSASGFCLAEIGATEEVIPTNEEKAAALADALNGLQVEGADGEVSVLNVTVADVAKTHEAVQTLIRNGRIKSLDALADGAGGHNNAEIASSSALFVFAKSFTDAVNGGRDVTEDTVCDAALTANNALVAFNRDKPEASITTFIAIVSKVDNEAYIAHVGDSRVYKQDAAVGNVVRLTEDDSLAEDILDSRDLSPTAFFSGGLNTSTIARSFGIPLRREDIHMGRVKLQPGDKLISLSDGSWEGIDLADPRTQAVFAAVDTAYRTNRDAGMDKLQARDIGYGTIFKEFNLNGAPDTPEELVEYFTREEVGVWSKDNVTALVTQRY